MSNRFHNKFHRQNHHSNPTAGYPDSSLDPIASFEQPFKGEFYSQGDIITTQNLSAGINLNVTNNANIFGTSVRTPNIGTGEDNSVVILNSSGYLKTDEINPGVWDTTMKFISASDGALTINRLTKAENSTGIDESIVFDNGTNVGIGTDTPGAKLDVNGSAIVRTNLTVNGDFTVLGTTSQLDTLVYTTSAVSITNTGSGPALTVTQTGSQPIAHFIDSNGDDIIFADNGYLGLGVASPNEKLTVSGNLSTSGTATIGTISDSLTNTSVVVQTAGLLQKRTLNAAAFDTTSKFVSASDGALTVNRLTKATDSTGINESIVFDNGTNVGIGTDTPGAKLDINGSAIVRTNLTVNGDFAVLGSTTQLDTVVSVTSALSVVNFGTGPALKIEQHGAQPIAHFIDANGDDIVFSDDGRVGINIDSPAVKLHVGHDSNETYGCAALFSETQAGNSDGPKIGFAKNTPNVKWTAGIQSGSLQTGFGINENGSEVGLGTTRFYLATGGNIGIGTSTPNEKLTVSGNLSTSGTATIGTIATGSTNSVVTESVGLIQKRTVNAAIWDTSARHISASDASLGTGYIPKAGNAFGIEDSVIFDNGTNVGIGTSSPQTKLHVSSGSGEILRITAGTMALYAGCDINDPWFGTSTNNDLRLVTNAIEKLRVTTSGNVGIGTTSPSAKLTISGNLSTSGTATIGTIALDPANTSFVTETNGLLKKRIVNVAATDTTATFVSASDGALTVNYLTKATNSNGINESIISDDGTRVGIGETSPEGKLHVKNGSAGTVTAQPSSVGVFESDGNAYISLLSPTSKYAGVVMGGPTNPYGSYLSWNHDNLDLKLSTNHAGADMHFQVDSEVPAMRITSAGDVGIGTTSPGAKLTVSGTISSSSTVNVRGIGTGTDNSVVILDANGFLRTDEINPSVWDTTAKFVSASDGALTVNRLTKATDSSGINESIVTDDGSLVSVGGNLSTTGTATIGTIADNTTGTSIVVQTAGLLQKRTLNTAAFDTTSKFVSASDGALTTNYLTKATNSNGINESIISDNGTLVYVGGHLTISGNLTALGNSYFANTLFTTTCAISVVNNGPGPALYVYQGPGASDVASFYDGDGVEVLHVGNCDPGQQFGKIGINTGDPNRELTVKGSVSATGSLNVSTINTNDTSNSFVVLGTDNVLQKRTINIAATNTTSKFVSASDGALTVNYLTKATDSNGINESIVFDNGTNVGIGTSSPVYKVHVADSGSNVYIGHNIEELATGNNNGGAVYFGPNIDSNPANPTAGIESSWGEATNPQIHLGVSRDGSKTRYSAFYDNTLKLYTNDIQRMIVDSAGNIGIGTASPSEKLTVSGNLSTSGTTTIGTLATGTGTSVLIESSGLLQKRTLNTAAFDTTSKFVSASDGALTVNRLTKATNSNGINESIVTDDGSLVSVGGNLSTTGTTTIGTLATGTSDSIVVESSGLLQKRTIDSRVWGSSLVDGTGTTNYVTKWSDSNTVTNSIVFDDGTNVGIGTSSPGVKLDVAGVVAVDYLRCDATDGVNEGGEIQLKGAGTNGDVQIDNHAGNLRVHTLGSSNYFQILGGGSTTALRVESGSAYIGKIDTGTTNSVIIESSGTLQKRTIDSTAWNPGATYQPIITGAATTIDSENLTVSRALVSDASGKVAVSDITSTELSYLDNVTSNIQTQLDGKQASLGFTPVQQGGGSNQSTNKLYIGWSTGSQLRLQVDVTDFGADWPINITGMHKPGTLSVTPQSTTSLPQSNDIEFTGQVAEVTISSFAGGIRGVTYTLTNKGSYNVIISSTSSIFVRGGNTWASNACSSYSGKIVLPPKHSCSARADSATDFSVW
jgi:hypothetical protein